jgi:hypothetical protein
MEEKRESTRFRVKQLIGYYPNREEYLWAEGVDISRGGISCVANGPVDALTNVYFMMSVPSPAGDRNVRGEGYVAHSHMEGDKCRFGIKIESIFEEDKAALEAYFVSLESEESPAQ